MYYQQYKNTYSKDKRLQKPKKNGLEKPKRVKKQKEKKSMFA